MVKTGSGRSWLNLFNWVRFLFTLKGAVSITLLLVVLTFWNGIADSIEEKSFEPFFRTVGGELINHDTKLYVESQEVINEGGAGISEMNFFQKLLFYFKTGGRLFANLWYMYTFGLVFYYVSIMFTNNESAKASNIALAIVFLAVMQIIGTFVIIDSFTEEEQVIVDEAPKIPFRGVVKFIEAMPVLMNPGDVLSPDEVVNETVNETVNVTRSGSYISLVNLLGENDDA